MSGYYCGRLDETNPLQRVTGETTALLPLYSAMDEPHRRAYDHLDSLPGLFWCYRRAVFSWDGQSDARVWRGKLRGY